jgi:DNA-binding protein YbaB
VGDVGREVDEAWIEEAIERYQRIEHLQAQFERTLAKVDVTVRSPDGLVEVVVTADGVIRDVVISDSAQGRSPRELSRAVHAAVTAAADAASWARSKVHQETFGDFRDLGSGSGGFGRDLGSGSGGFGRDLGSGSGASGWEFRGAKPRSNR